MKQYSIGAAVIVAMALLFIIALDIDAATSRHHARVIEIDDASAVPATVMVSHHRVVGDTIVVAGRKAIVVELMPQYILFTF